MASPKKPEMVRPGPLLVVEGVGPKRKESEQVHFTGHADLHPESAVPRRSTKVPKIVPDNLNIAIHTAGMQSLHPGTPVMFSSSEIASIASGIRSLVAERDMLRKLMKEAYQAGDTTVRGSMWHEGDFDPDNMPTPWEKSAFPAKLERPWGG